MHGHPDKVSIPLNSGGDRRLFLGGERGKRREFDDHRTALPQCLRIDDLQAAIGPIEGIERRRIQVGY